MSARPLTLATTARARALAIIAVLVSILGAYGERWQLDVLADLPARGSVGVGDTAPMFQAADLSGGTVSLDELRGRVVVVNFWATWCPPCRVELPELDAYQAEMGERIVVLGIDTGEPSGSVEPFVLQHGLRFPIMLDENGSIAAAYGVVGLPTSLILDRSGIVRERVTGPMTRDTLARRIERLL
ncbi:TlpA disulfide reductase family protein [Luteitalea sp.]|uniref:TlpA family protein disulfide reductase n=1 Tax=Luteitalea sp. TaxID=2004800 RepID=UPI0025C04072|nr:TlpA disulfide reductase family protein [Luteitalea sp.]